MGAPVAAAKQQGDRLKRSGGRTARPGEFVERQVHDVVAGKGEPSEAFHERKFAAPAVVVAAIDQLRANDARGEIEIELEIVGLSEMPQSLPNRRGNFRRWQVWPEHDDVIGV